VIITRTSDDIASRPEEARETEQSRCGRLRQLRASVPLTVRVVDVLVAGGVHQATSIGSPGLIVDMKDWALAMDCVERIDEDLVRFYFADISRYPLLNKDDEMRLAQQIERGNAAREALAGDASLSPVEERALRRSARQGEESQQAFVHSNLRLVVSIAKRYQWSTVPLLDLIQEGNLGLMHAVEKFDWHKGFKFSTYATWWIRRAITVGIANQARTIRLPVHAGDALAQLQNVRSRLELDLHRPATCAELAAEMATTEAKVIEVLRFPAQPVSLSEPLRDDGNAVFEDVVEDRAVVSPSDSAEAALLPRVIEKLLAPLDERERKIIALRFGLDCGEPRTLEQVGEYFNLTRERIRQIEARAMSKLRERIDINAHDLLEV
jgi:RNA polymerase sigma factor (sigma-70 family)